MTLFFPIEPPVGAAVLLALYRRYGDLWLVELLFNDLLRWNDFFLEERTCDATNLTCLGSWNQLTQYNDGQVCSAAISSCVPCSCFTFSAFVYGPAHVMCCSIL